MSSKIINEVLNLWWNYCYYYYYFGIKMSVMLGGFWEQRIGEILTRSFLILTYLLCLCSLNIHLEIVVSLIWRTHMNSKLNGLRVHLLCEEGSSKLFLFVGVSNFLVRVIHTLLCAMQNQISRCSQWKVIVNGQNLDEISQESFSPYSYILVLPLACFIFKFADLLHFEVWDFGTF